MNHFQCCISFQRLLIRRCQGSRQLLRVEARGGPKAKRWRCSASPSRPNLTKILVIQAATHSIWSLRSESITLGREPVLKVLFDSCRLYWPKASVFPRPPVLLNCAFLLWFNSQIGICPILEASIGDRFLLGLPHYMREPTAGNQEPLCFNLHLSTVPTPNSLALSTARRCSSVTKNARLLGSMTIELVSPTRWYFNIAIEHQHRNCIRTSSMYCIYIYICMFTYYIYMYMYIYIYVDYVYRL